MVCWERLIFHFILPSELICLQNISYLSVMWEGHDSSKQLREKEQMNLEVEDSESSENQRQLTFYYLPRIRKDFALILSPNMTTLGDNLI